MLILQNYAIPAEGSETYFHIKYIFSLSETLLSRPRHSRASLGADLSVQTLLHPHTYVAATIRFLFRVLATAMYVLT